MSHKSSLPEQDAFCFKSGSYFKEVYPGFGDFLFPNDHQDGRGEKSHTEFCFFWQVDKFKTEKVRASYAGDIIIDEVEKILASIMVEITVNESNGSI